MHTISGQLRLTATVLGVGLWAHGPPWSTGRRQHLDIAREQDETLALLWSSRHCASMDKTTRMAFALCTDKRRTFVVMKEQAMMDDASHKAGRIEIRLTAQDKALFKRAQVLSGDKSVSSFILRIVKNHAQKLIAENDKILVSERDQAVFFEAVLGEVKPNAALKQAFDRHQSAMQDQ
jgi:uncharacterized protein (DUF1778 family)